MWLNNNVNQNTAAPNSSPESPSADLMVGARLKDLRTQRGFSLRALAERSDLNINTLSLIENGKSSPSVSTLQQLAQALAVPIAAFFASDPVEKEIVFTPASQRPGQFFGSTEMQNLGKDLSATEIQPFVVTLQPGMGSGDQMIVHTGLEFVYCLSGSIHYEVEQQEFTLEAGDSLVFKAPLPHCWENKTKKPAQILLILYSCNEGETSGERHFSLQTSPKRNRKK